MSDTPLFDRAPTASPSALPPPVEYSLLDFFERQHLNKEWLALPFAAMRDVSAAVQTLAGLRLVSKHATFVPIGEIAYVTCRPVRTVERDLSKLQARGRGWIANLGRQRPSPASQPRRTCTRQITEKTNAEFNKTELAYGLIHRMFCVKPRSQRRLSWPARAILSVILARMAGLRASMPDQGSEDFWEELANREDRFAWSLGDLADLTGLDRKSIVTAKVELKRHGFVCRVDGQASGGRRAAERLVPNRAFQVVVSPTPEEGVSRLAWTGGNLALD